MQDTDGISVETLLCCDDFQQELVLELQGLKAFLEQKACSAVPPVAPGANFADRNDVIIGTTPLAASNEVAAYIMCVGSLVHMLKSARSRNTSSQNLEDRDDLEK